jgi:hypothetical protein
VWIVGSEFRFCGRVCSILSLLNTIERSSQAFIILVQAFTLRICTLFSSCHTDMAWHEIHAWYSHPRSLLSPTSSPYVPPRRSKAVEPYTHGDADSNSDASLVRQGSITTHASITAWPVRSSCTRHVSALEDSPANDGTRLNRPPSVLRQEMVVALLPDKRIVVNLHAILAWRQQQHRH